jgi:tRNA threonylcarbamoyladenosine biosynthesis protein TsaB
MRILAVDTATASCSVGVLDAERLMAEVTIEKKQTHSKHLMELIDTTVQMAGVRLNEMDAFAVTIGPGSFTGVRIGVSTVKGFAMALSKPVVGVSSLEALACQAGSGTGSICPLLDARKGEVYAALYQFEEDGLREIIGEQVSSIEDLLVKIDAPCVFVGNGALIHEELIQKEYGITALQTGTTLNKIRAETIGSIAMHKIQTKGHENLSALVPHYIRQSDAEINAGRKKIASKNDIDNY